MDKNNINLTTPEITGLWQTYIQNRATECVLMHFISYLRDEEIKTIVDEALKFSQTQSEQIKNIFIKDKFPIPVAFSDEDVNLLGPPLYSDLFALSFVYRLSQINLHHYGATTSKVARNDVVEYFSTGLESVTVLYKKCSNLMLTKGIYDRPPKISYPSDIQFIQKKSYLGDWFGDQRPLNSAELGEIFFVVERNYIGLNLILGLIQVTKNKKIKQFLIQGKELCKKQISIFNDLLQNEELFEIAPVPMEFTDSDQSPFSEKLILFLITMTTATSISLLGYAMSVSMRKDLTAHYSRIIAEVMLYGEAGMKLMIDHKWMEQPPSAIDQKVYQKK